MLVLCVLFCNTEFDIKNNIKEMGVASSDFNRVLNDVKFSKSTSGGSSGSRGINQSKSIERQVKKLSTEAKNGYKKVIEALEKGDTRGLNDHPLTGNRSGQRAVDIKATGRGRGAGRIIYEFGENGDINIIEILTDHKY